MNRFLQTPRELHLQRLQRWRGIEQRPKEIALRDRRVHGADANLEVREPLHAEKHTADVFPHGAIFLTTSPCGSKQGLGLMEWVPPRYMEGANESQLRTRREREELVRGFQMDDVERLPRVQGLAGFEIPMINFV